MFFSVSHQSNELIARGKFVCPHCKERAIFSHRRVVVNQTGYVLMFPYSGVADVVGEYVICEACNAEFDASILLEASDVELTGSSQESRLRNVVTISDAAAAEIRRRMQMGSFEQDVYVRLVPSRDGNECDVRFDYPYADDEEWLGRAKGLPIVIDRDLADSIMGFEVDFDGEKFIAQ